MKNIVLGDESPMTLLEMPWTFILAIIHSSNHNKKGKKRSFTNIDDLLTLTADIYSYTLRCFTLSYRIVKTNAALNYYISDYCDQYKEDPHQGLCCDYYPLYIKGLKDVVMFAPSCLFYALVEEEEDKLVEIRSIRPGWKSTQENKQHWCANTFIAINNELWNNDI